MFYFFIASILITTEYAMIRTLPACTLLWNIFGSEYFSFKQHCRWHAYPTCIMNSLCLPFRCKDSWVYSPSIFCFFEPANLYSYGLRRAQTHLVSFTSLRYLSLWIRWTSNLFVFLKPSSYANVSPQFCWMDMRVRVSSLQLFSCRRCTWFCMMWIAASTTAVGYFCFLKRGAFTRAACNDQTWGSYNIWYPYFNFT